MIDLLKAIRARVGKHTEFAYGVLTADAYVKTLQDCVGLSACYRLASKGHTSFADLMHKAARTLVYSNPDMVLEEKASNGSLAKDVELPKNTLMTFRHVLTSSKKDRDGDVLHSDGAAADPNMLLLWQHVHTLPIGKMIQVVDQNKNRLVVVSAIVDMNELCHDSAVMIDNGMGRFSHGFKALEFTETKADVGGPGGGFDVTKFEIMEESLVSVPANVDAQTEEVILSLVEGGKLISPMLKRVGKGIRSRRNVSLPGVTIQYREQAGQLKKELVCQSISDLKAASDAGLIGGQKDENESGNRAEEGTGRKNETNASEKANDNASDDENEEGSNSKVTYICECLDCGEVVESKEHCRDIKCPKCGGEMRRKERPGPGQVAKSKKSEVAATVSTLSDSWEAIRDHLSRALNDFLASCGMALRDGDYCWIIATFSDHVIVQVNRRDRADSWYSIPWKLIDDIPTLEAKPKEVEIETTTEIVEKALQYCTLAWIDAKPYPNEHAARIADPDKYEKLRRQNNKFGEGIHAIFGITDDGKTEIQAIRFDRGQFTAAEAKKWLEDHDYESIEFEESSGKDIDLVGLKMGRVLSVGNEKKIREAKEHIDEVHGSGEMAISYKAMLRIASGNLKDVLGSLTDVGETEVHDMDIKTAIAHVLTHATPEQRKSLVDTLQTIENVERQNQQVEQYKSFVHNDASRRS